MDFRFEVLLDVVFVTDSVVFATASELVLLLLLLTFSFFSGGCKDCIIVDGASLRIEMVEVDGSANFDSGGGRLQLEVVVDVEPEAEVDSPAAICGCITFDDKSHVKLVKSLWCGIFGFCLFLCSQNERKIYKLKSFLFSNDQKRNRAARKIKLFTALVEL